MQEIRARLRAGHEKARIAAGEDEAHAHRDVFLHERMIVAAAHAGMLAVPAAGIDHHAVRLLDARIRELPGDAELGAEIVGADEQHVDARHRGDRIGLRDRLRRFQHQHDERLGIGHRRRFAHRHAAIGELRQRAHHRAVAERRVLAVGHRALRLVDAVDVRHHDALRARVEQPRRMEVLLARHAHDRRDADRERGHRDLRRAVDVHRVVLHVDEQPVVAAGPADGGDVHGAREAQAHAEGEPALGKLAPGVIRIDAHAALTSVRRRPSSSAGRIFRNRTSRAPPSAPASCTTARRHRACCRGS
jgi:hypothetical protein